MKKILFALIALLGIAACEKEPATTAENIKLTVDNSEIYANGIQTVTFSVTNDKGDAVEGATIYFAETNEALAGNTFTTKYAGEYTFYAKRGEAKSNTVKVVAKQVTEDTKVITLAAAYPEMLFVGENVTFDVYCNDVVVTEESTIYNAADDTALEGYSFTSEVGGDFTFYAIYDNIKSNYLTITFLGEQTPTELILSVTPSTIVANGTDKAQFSLEVDGKAEANFEVYNAADNTKLTGKEFSTTTAGSYKFYAMYDGKKSNTVEVTATEEVIAEDKPISIAASKDVIKANGIEYAQITVTEEGGADVTTSSTIYVNGGVLNGSKFSTTTPGTYTIYATKGSQTSAEITITAEEVETGSTIVFAEGVTLSSGWYDVNKMAAGDNGDTMMCWAAAASNMIQWWQDRYVAAGFSLPAGAVSGEGTKLHSGMGFGRCYELALMDVFHSDWENLTRGSQSDYAISWYFEGKLNGGEYASPGSQAKPKTPGGYFKSVWNDIYPHLYHEYEDGAVPWLCYDLYTTCFNNYTLWGKKSGNECLMEFSDYIKTAIKRGVASLTIQPGSDALHAITLWGYEMSNETGFVTRIWVTDSDDQITEPKTTELNEYKVTVSGSKIKLNGTTRYGECTIVDVIPLSGYGSAE